MTLCNSISILFLTCFTSSLLYSCAAGQNFKNYPFVYRLGTASLNDKEEFKIDTLKNSEAVSTVEAVIKDFQASPVQFLTVIWKSNDTTITKTTNEKGMFSINLKPSIYELTITGAGYKTLIKKISIDKTSNYNLAIDLARQPTMNWYNIHSRKNLSQADLDSIKNCIQHNEQSPDKCKKKYDYYITFEI